MPIVSIMTTVPALPDRATAKQQVGAFMTDLFGLWMQHHGSFLAGKTFYFLGFQPGAYPRADAGVVQGLNPFQRGAPGKVPYVFAVSDDPEDEKTVHCLWKINPDPGFFPEGVYTPPA